MVFDAMRLEMMIQGEKEGIGRIWTKKRQSVDFPYKIPTKK